jgi:LacI family transcriptional regulator
MSKRSTIYEVARRSGVSTATVSRVMRDGTGFSAQTRDRVLRVAAEIGWVPSGSARGLASHRAGIVGLLFPDLGVGGPDGESPLYVDQVIRGAEQAATAAGDAVLIAATRGSSGRDLALSVSSKVDGLVVVARSLSEADLATLGRRLPVVVLSGRAGRLAEVDSVTVDNVGGMRALVEHLLDVHGYRDLAFISGPPRSPDSTQRFAGYRQAMRAAGLDAPKVPHAVGHFTEAGGARATRELLADRRPPDAIVCGNDQMAIGALDALTSLQLRAPWHVAVTGFDDLAAARHVRPHLTTVAQPMRDLGARAVAAVLSRLDDPAAPRLEAVLPTQVVVRRSCGCRPTRSERTRRSGRTAA